MEFRILGPVQAVSDGSALALGGTKQRALLALLVLHANETLSRERLIDELWGERPPATAQKAVQVYMSRLRKALGGAAGVIVTREVGYQLVIDPESIDAHRFELRLEEAKRAPPDRAETLLEEALALWRGAPLEDLAHEPFAQRYAERLEDLRLAGLELLIEAQLARGRHDAVVQRLERLIPQHPYRERFRAQLMLALYRSDRQADALQAYHDARRTLVEDLGIEPGERLRELERAILAQDIADDHVSEPARAAPVAALPRALRVPRGAPFVGRERELARLRGLWEETGCVAVAITGEAGIGKTRLAAELARLVPGPVLYGRCDEGLSAPYQPLADALRPAVEALGSERLRAGLGPLAAHLSALFPQLEGLGSPPRADPGSEQHALFEAVAALFALAAPRALLVVDDLQWAPPGTLRLLRHLLRSDRQLKLLVLLTYRDTEAAGLLAGDVESMPLGGLDEASIAALLEAAGREARLAGQLRTDTNGNPLFVREVLATGALGAPPETLRQVIAQRVGRLSDPAQRVLTVAAVAGQEFSVAVVERVVGEDLDLLDALDEASAARLLAEAGHGDYVFAHALVRQTIYDGLSAARRARLHLRVGEALEALGDTGALVHHFSEAGEAAKAADLALAAGREAAKRHAYEEAAVHYRRGLAARPDRERQRALQLALERTRYQPLPDLGALPAWVWRRLPLPAKVAAALIGVAALALGLALGPGIERSKREDAAEQAQQSARSRAEYVERVRAEQRPRFGTAAGSRTNLLRAAATAVGADARARRRGPVLRVACEPHPAGSTPDPSARVGRYACLAVTAEIPATDRSPAGATGHDYRVRIEFDSGRYAYCKVASVATKSLREPIVPLPRACSAR